MPQGRDGAPLVQDESQGFAASQSDWQHGNSERRLTVDDSWAEKKAVVEDEARPAADSTAARNSTVLHGPGGTASVAAMPNAAIAVKSVVFGGEGEKSTSEVAGSAIHGVQKETAVLLKSTDMAGIPKKAGTKPKPAGNQFINHLPVFPRKDARGTSGTRNPPTHSTGFDGVLKSQITANDMYLRDLAVLQDRRALEKVDVRGNKLQSIGNLSGKDQMTYLDASHNCLASLEDFELSLSANALHYLNLSHNLLRCFSTPGLLLLRHLDLSGNRLEAFPTLADTLSLTTLQLQNNCIETIPPFTAPNLDHLNLEGNQIKKIENLAPCQALKLLKLSHNPISSLAGVENCMALERLHIHHAELCDLRHVENALHLPHLWDLDLANNTLQDMDRYRKRLLALPWKSNLRALDKERVLDDEKVGAQLGYSPPLEIWALRRFMQLKGKRYLSSLSQPSNITMPEKDTPYPLLVLVGPAGSGKKVLCRRLVEDFPDYFSLGISHTTRPTREGNDRNEYYFVEEAIFTAMAGKGEFIEIADLWGHHYGLSISEVERNASKGLATVTHMELDGALQLKDSYFNPRLVMMVPMSERVHEERMWQRSCYRKRQIQHAVSRAKIVVEYHNEHPAVFDIGINTNVMEKGHQQLRNLVQDYLGLPFDPMSSRSGATSGGDDTTVMSSPAGSTSTLETSRHTTPGSGLPSGPQSRAEASPPLSRVEGVATQSGAHLSASHLPPQQRHLLKWSIPSSRGSFTALDRSTTMLVPEEQLRDPKRT